MYSFIYYFIYTGVKDRNPDPIFYSTGGVVFMQGIHLFLLASVLQFFNVVEIHRLHEEYFLNKLMFFPIGIAWLFIAFKFFSKKSKSICLKFDAAYNKRNFGKKLYSIKNIIIIAALYIIPLVIGIRVLNLGK